MRLRHFTAGVGKPRRGGALGFALCVPLAVLLAGCAGRGGALLVDSGQYDGYHCNDLTNEWRRLNDREKVLHNLSAKASVTTGGTVIATATYSTELETIRVQKNNVQREATEKNCELTKVYQSDQTIR